MLFRSSSDVFSDYQARKQRYAILFSHYENNAYRDIKQFSQAYKTAFGLYRFTRAIYSPAYRLAEFWKAHLWGGVLDPDAGDGKEVPSCLPIITENEDLRLAIAQIFAWSNWNVKKNVVSLKGTILGDSIIKVVDDTKHDRVYLKSVHPGTIKSISLDPTSNVKEYYIEEIREDPRKSRSSSSKYVVYGERASRNGEMVVYETFLNGKPYAWPGNITEDENGKELSVEKWEEPYGFIPMVFIKHNDVGLDWGWSEYHAVQSKIREVDDLASKLSDQIRKSIAAPMLLAGVRDPNTELKLKTPEKKASSPEKGRETIHFVYGDVGAQAHKLYSDLNIEQTAGYIKDILRSIEDDYPELRSDPRNITGEISGRALRMLRQDADDKVKERRPLYDDALARALQMATTIGGMRGYEEFKPFNLESFEKGDMPLRIGNRPVFTKDPLEDLEYEEKLWDVASKAASKGMSIPLFLEQHGWEEDDINEFIGTTEYQARLKSIEMVNEGFVPSQPDLEKKRMQSKGKKSEKA